MKPFPPKGTTTALTPQSWMVTFTDLLGLVLAMFVLIYATSDRQAETLRQAVITLQSALFVEPTTRKTTIVADVMSPAGYQTALLQKYISALPYWTLDAQESDHLQMTLEGQSLANALGDGTWLDIVERFERPVSMQVFFPRAEDAAAAYSAAQKLMDMRADRGLSSNWTISVEPAARNSGVRAHIDIAAEDQAGSAVFVDPIDLSEADKVEAL